MEGIKVSKESLQKAMETLGLVKAENSTIVEQTATVIIDPKVEELKKAEEELLAVQAKIEGLKNPTTTVVEKTQIGGEIIKGFEDKLGSLVTLIQSKDEAIAELAKSVSELNEFNKALTSKIGTLERTPLVRKSVDARGLERFVNDNTSGNAAKDVRVMSLSNKKQRAEVANELFTKATAGGVVDAELQKACEYVELGHVPDDLKKRLLSEFKIQMVK